MSRPLSLSLFLAGVTLAGAQTAQPPAPAHAEPVTLENFVVSASPFARAQDEIAAPTSVLAGQRLLLQRAGSLGETLAGEPGISSTWFGPGASRPVIRGLGGDRIRVLQGGIGTLDASVISPDHAVSLDPLLIDRIEIVRGPATLLYGGSAIGGVVNVIDARIPEEAPASALGGRLETRLGSAAEERAAAGVLTGKAGAFAWRLDGFTRQTDDIRIPDFAETAALLEDHDEDEEGPPARGILPNTATKTSGAGLGLTYLSTRGHLGFSYSGFDSLYGVPGHKHGHEEEEEEHEEEEHADEHGDEGVRLDLRQRRWDVHGELFDLTPLIHTARLQLGVADYRHDELEGDEIGTRFTNRAYEGRLEFLHNKIGAFEGAVGAQVSRSDFTADGEEAFVPPTITNNLAIFLYEEIARERVTWQLGARVERQEVKPDAGTGLAARSHTGASLSGGAVWKLDDTWSLAVSLNRSERAPNAQELYADGPHAGTGSYEIGDATLGLERAHGLDVSLRKRAGRVTGVATVFVNDFDGYIFEQATGEEEDELPVYAFVQRDARFHGAELELIAHLHESTGRQFDLRFVADTVRATNRTDDTPLPRITPARAGVGLDYRHGALTFSSEFRHSFAQNRTAPNETATDSHTLVNVSAAWRFKLGSIDAELFARGTNLNNTTARVHSSFLKDVAPLPGRDVTLGLRVAF